MADKNKVSLVIFSGDLDKLLAGFIIATGAAASGMKVSMFFTFWGLKLIQKEGAKTSKMYWMKRLFSWMLRPGPDKRTLSKMNFLGLGPIMIRKLMKRSKVPHLRELMTSAKALGVEFTACTTSMEIMGVTKETLIPEVDRIAGVTSFLADAKQSDFTLFI